MKITSLDIRKQDFNRSFRGYDIDEVESFLQVVAAQWQEMVDDLRRSDEKIQEQQLKLDHYMKVEEALEEALQTARSSARITIENAEKKARKTMEDAENRIVDLQKNADSERLQIKRDTAKYAVRQQEIVAKLRAFLMSEMEILSHFDAENGRSTLSGGSSVKEIELVRDESKPASISLAGTGTASDTSDAIDPDEFGADDMGPDNVVELHSVSANESASEEMSSPRESREEREGSRSSWEKLEEEVDVTSVAPANRTSGKNVEYEEPTDEDEDWDDEDDDWDDDLDDDLDDEDDDWDLDDDEDDEDLVDEEEEDSIRAEQEDGSEKAPSWKVTPIFESVDDLPDAASGDSGADQKQTARPASKLERVNLGSDVEADEEIRKIHQILKDLDEE